MSEDQRDLKGATSLVLEMLLENQEKQIMIFEKGEQLLISFWIFEETTWKLGHIISLTFSSCNPFPSKLSGDKNA